MISNTLVSRLMTIVAGLMALCAAARVCAAPIPYSTDFSSDPAWTNATTGTGTVDTGNSWAKTQNGVFDVKLSRGSTGAVNSISSVSLTGLTNSGFYISATVSAPVSCTDGFNDSVGLRFLAGSATSDNDSYIADLNIGSLNAGCIRIVEYNTDGTTAVYPSSTQANQGHVPNFSRTGSYKLEVTGQYNTSGALTINYKVTDLSNPANTAQISNLVLNGSNVGPDATPRSGNYFGFRSGIGSSGAAALQAQFDNFAVTPEPCTTALLAVGSITGIVARRRR